VGSDGVTTQRAPHRVWLAIALASAALGPDADAAEVGPSPQERVHQTLDRIWDWQMTSYPEFATYVGVPGHDDRWTDESSAAIARRQQDLQGFLRELEALEVSGLDADAQLDRELVVKGLREEIEAFRFHPEYLAIDPLEGVQLDVAQVLELMPASTAPDFENMLARLRAVPVLVEQNLALLQAGLASGITTPRITLRDVPQQLRDLIPDDPGESPLLRPFAEMPEAIPPERRAALRREAERILVAEVYPAYRKLLAFMEETYIPGARETIGQFALPDGEAWYAFNVRSHTTTDLTPQQIHAIGLAEVDRIRGEMQGLIEELGFDGSLAEFAEFLRTDPRFYFDSEAELLSAYRDICKRADPQLVHLFGTLPRLTYGVEPVPAFKAKSAPTGYFQPGSLEAGRPATFFANTYDLKTRPSWEMEALVLHEAVPGHHLQIALAQELEGIHDLLKHSFYTAFTEGWGLYAESLGDEMGFYRDPYAKFGQLTYEMWRAIRLVVDTGIHAKGWTRQQAIEFFEENAAKNHHDIVVEVDRYIVWPGQALAYKIGQLEFAKLRARAQQELGPAFDIRSFHDQLLLRGAMPLDVLEERVTRWIERVKREGS
jgi:uncharacterized protein (DUF885 family)